MEKKMFPIKSNEEIGAYFQKLVEKNFPSMRKFAAACLELRGEDTDKTTVDNFCNRLSQIKQGRKGIQVTDLPVFTALLGVTSEELLSAGEWIVPEANFMTVRQFAASRDPEVWDRFLAREDRVFLNVDEFGKNALEYGLEFHNYAMLRHLVEKGYIWLIEPEDELYRDCFAVGTSIQPRNYLAVDQLYYGLSCPPEDGPEKLRRKFICLAVEHSDLAMLKTLKAREISAFYAGYRSFGSWKDVKDYDVSDLVSHIADAEDAVLEYFSQEYHIPGVKSAETAYIFPFMKELIAVLLEKKHPYTPKVLKNCINHNRRFLNTIEKVIEEIRKEVHEEYRDSRFDDEWLEDLVRGQYRLFPLNYAMMFMTLNEKHFVTKCNPVSLDIPCDDPQLAPLVQEVQNSYQQILDTCENR